MIVVGGTYREYCDNPPRPRPGDPPLLGSGVRAAAALRQVTEDVELRSAIETESRDEAELMLGGAFGLRGHWATRTEPVVFRYFTPLSSPTIDGRLSEAPALAADSRTVLVFGMIEADAPSVQARSVVFDPQRPRDLTAPRIDSVNRERLAIVANRAEIGALGGADEPGDSAQRVLDRYGADVVVVKAGAVGAMVCTPGSSTWVGPRPTTAVYPIGSGDVFSAAFAWAWGEDGQEPVDASKFASLATAQWCSAVEAAPAVDARQEIPELAAAVRPMVYLAGPFFTLAQRWLVNLARDALLDLGAGVFSPFHDVGHGGPEVAIRDLEGLANCASVLALLDGADAGTLFETGYATSRMPIVCYAEQPDPEGWKMLSGTGAELHHDLSTAVYRSIWAAMGMPLMTT